MLDGVPAMLFLSCIRVSGFLIPASFHVISILSLERSKSASILQKQGY